jgi:hypothetical protein
MEAKHERANHDCALGALYAAGFVVNKRGTLLRFEKCWHIADGAIRRYRKAGLLWWRVAPT